MNTLYVHLDVGGSSRRVGILYLSEKLGRHVFSYDREFISSALEISPLGLPLRPETFVAERNPDLYDLHGVFADALPDEWGRKVQDAEFAKIGLYEPSALDRLAFVGGRGIGALRFEPAREYARGQAAVSLAELRKAALRVIAGKAEEVAAELLRSGGSAGGARPKFLVDLHTQSLARIQYSRATPVPGFVPVVLKVPDRGGDRYQRVEYAYMLMAREAGLRTPETWLLTGERSGQAFLAVRRFDILANGNRLHTHTFAGLLGVNFRAVVPDYTALLRLAGELTRDHREVVEAFRRMVFNYLGFNNDDHAKNFTFLMDHTGRWSLSPAYDIAYSTSTGGLHAMAINGKRRNATLRDFEQVARDFDITPWREIVRQTAAALRRWPAHARACSLSTRLASAITQRINENTVRVGAG